MNSENQFVETNISIASINKSFNVTKWEGTLKELYVLFDHLDILTQKLKTMKTILLFKLTGTYTPDYSGELDGLNYFFYHVDELNKPYALDLSDLIISRFAPNISFSKMKQPNISSSHIRFVFLPNTLISLEGAFIVDCTQLEYICIPESINILGEHAVCNCPKALVDVKTDTNNIHGVFAKNVKKLLFKNPERVINDQFYVSSNGKKILSYLKDKVSVINIPDHITTIGKNCFHYIHTDKIIFPSSLTKIESQGLYANPLNKGYVELFSKEELRIQTVVDSIPQTIFIPANIHTSFQPNDKINFCAPNYSYEIGIFYDRKWNGKTGEELMSKLNSHNQVLFMRYAFRNNATDLLIPLFTAYPELQNAFLETERFLQKKEKLEEMTAEAAKYYEKLMRDYMTQIVNDHLYENSITYETTDKGLCFIRLIKGSKGCAKPDAITPQTFEFCYSFIIDSKYKERLEPVIQVMEALSHV
ncbi:MAG: leucine-rich repeat domain-containing protein [Treponema sp.]|nr:leucine-rich repeat domain-containing protein [Treponema sp.]